MTITATRTDAGIGGRDEGSTRGAGRSARDQGGRSAGPGPCCRAVGCAADGDPTMTIPIGPGTKTSRDHPRAGPRARRRRRPLGPAAGCVACSPRWPGCWPPRWPSAWPSWCRRRPGPSAPVVAVGDTVITLVPEPVKRTRSGPSARTTRSPSSPARSSSSRSTPWSSACWRCVAGGRASSASPCSASSARPPPSAGPPPSRWPGCPRSPGPPPASWPCSSCSGR